MRGDVYEQSRWLALKVVKMYYNENCTQDEIATELRISKPTVSRLLKRGKEQGYIRFVIPDSYEKCLKLGVTIKKYCNLIDVIVVPEAFLDEESPEHASSMRNLVAMEGARYLQRILSPNDILGIGWGRTMGLLVNYLNPCQRMDIPFISLHGSLEEIDPSLDVEYLTRRITMAFGGQCMSLRNRALRSSEEDLQSILSQESVKRIFDVMNRITITISSIGSFYPEITTPLAKTSFLNEDDIRFLKEQGVICDYLLHFLNRDGVEIDSALARRTLGISLEMLNNIPCKIIVANGRNKANGIATILRARLANALIIDETLAEELLTLL